MTLHILHAGKGPGSAGGAPCFPVHIATLGGLAREFQQYTGGNVANRFKRSPKATTRSGVFVPPYAAHLTVTVAHLGGGFTESPPFFFKTQKLAHVGVSLCSTSRKREHEGDAFACLKNLFAGVQKCPPL